MVTVSLVKELIETGKAISELLRSSVESREKADGLLRLLYLEVLQNIAVLELLDKEAASTSDDQDLGWARVGGLLKTEVHQAAFLTMDRGVVAFADPVSEIPARFRQLAEGEVDEQDDGTVPEADWMRQTDDHSSNEAVLRSLWFVCVKTHALNRVGAMRESSGPPLRPLRCKVRVQNILRHEIQLARVLQRTASVK